MINRRPCTGYRPEEPRGNCKHGFPQTSPCAGMDGVPQCCMEEWCGWIYNDNGGKPRLPNQTERQP